MISLCVFYTRLILSQYIRKCVGQLFVRYDMCLPRNIRRSPHRFFQGQDEEPVAEITHEIENFTQVVTWARPDNITRVLHEQQENENTIQQLEESLGVNIRVLVASERIKLPLAPYAGSHLHWIPLPMTVVEGVAPMYMSHPYRRAFVQISENWQRVEPCTMVVGERVVLCIEVFVSSRDVMVYRDVVVSLDTPLCDVLAATACALGQSKWTRFTYMTCGHEGWECLHFDAIMLTMAMRDVLCLHRVQQSNTVDFFLISPVFLSERQEIEFIVCEGS